MFQQAQSNRAIPGAVATVGVNERVTFLRKTYAHLGLAIFAFVALEYVLLDMDGPLFEAVTVPFLKLAGSSWLIILALFMGVSWVADKWANSDTSRGVQYLGLGLYVIAEALIFTPILLIANLEFPGVIADAAVLTLFLFGGLTATVFITKKDFSFMRGALTIAGFGAMALIVISILFGFHLGTIFSGAMILLASGYVLYYTSNVLHHYRPTQYVAASLALFAAIALLFWYVLRILMALRD
jgi:FtsH-binding integral membrane protein